MRFSGRVFGTSGCLLQAYVSCVSWVARAVCAMLYLGRQVKFDHENVDGEVHGRCLVADQAGVVDK